MIELKLTDDEFETIEDAMEEAVCSLNFEASWQTERKANALKEEAKKTMDLLEKIRIEKENTPDGEAGEQEKQ